MQGKAAFSCPFKRFAVKRKALFLCPFFNKSRCPGGGVFYIYFKAAGPQKGVLSRMLETKLKPNIHPLCPAFCFDGEKNKSSD